MTIHKSVIRTNGTLLQYALTLVSSLELDMLQESNNRYYLPIMYNSLIGAHATIPMNHLIIESTNTEAGKSHRPLKYLSEF